MFDRGRTIRDGGGVCRCAGQEDDCCDGVDVCRELGVVGTGTGIVTEIEVETATATETGRLRGGREERG